MRLKQEQKMSDHEDHGEVKVDYQISSGNAINEVEANPAISTQWPTSQIADSYGSPSPLLQADVHSSQTTQSLLLAAPDDSRSFSQFQPSTTTDMDDVAHTKAESKHEVETEYRVGKEVEQSNDVEMKNESKEYKRWNEDVIQMNRCLH